MIYLWLKLGETEMAELGYGRTPIDISIQNWALKLAKRHVVTLMEGKGQHASGMRVREIALEMVKDDPKWIERAIRKVLGKSKGYVR